MPAKKPTQEPLRILDAEGYDKLADILHAAFLQASAGKGKTRHANDLPFEKQPMQQVAHLHGIGFITGQVTKKLKEAQGMLERGETAAAIHEMLGAIVYTAGAAVYVNEHPEEYRG